MPVARIRVAGEDSLQREADVFYAEHGTGRPLLAVHGWTLDHRAQAESLEPLFADRPGWRRIYPDLPGHGRTRAPGWIRSHDDMFGVLDAFLDVVVPEEHCCVAGLSYGCALVGRLIDQRPAAISGVLLTVPPTGDDQLPEFIVRRDDADFVTALGPDEQHQLEFVVWQSPQVLDEVRRRFDAGATLCDRSLLELLGGPSCVLPLARPFDRPTLVVAGRFDHWCGYRKMFKLLDDYPLATFAVLDGAGHALTIEREALYRALVADWLDRVEAS